jgi:pyocin large subunit-like protein
MFFVFKIANASSILTFTMHFAERPYFLIRSKVDIEWLSKPVKEAKDFENLRN